MKANSLHLPQSDRDRHTLTCLSVLVPIHAATHMPAVGPTAIATCALEAIVSVSEQVGD